MNIFGLEIAEKVYLPIFIILIALILNTTLQIIINSKLKINQKLSKHEQRSRKTVLILVQNIIKVIIVIISILSILQVFGVNTSALVAGVGAASLVIGLAFQDMLKDFLVGSAIIMESQYAIGELVEINGFKGEVTSLSLKSTRLKSLTGETCIISNRMINTVINYSLGDYLAIADICVSYDSDINKVEKILTELCSNLKSLIPEIKGNVNLDGINELADSSVVFRISAKTSAKNINVVKRKILREAKLILDKNKISIPFPQLEVHYEK